MLTEESGFVNSLSRLFDTSYYLFRSKARLAPVSLNTSTEAYDSSWASVISTRASMNSPGPTTCTSVWADRIFLVMSHPSLSLYDYLYSVMTWSRRANCVHRTARAQPDGIMHPDALTAKKK
jgi:hypothetical protein